MKKLFLLVLTPLVFCTAQAQTDTIPVYFATGKSVMNDAVKNQVVDYIYKDVLRSKQAIQIVGYADYVGDNKYNDKLSKARANTVKHFLTGFGFEEKDITICIGKGEVNREGMTGKTGFARDRRVDIVTNPAPVEAPVEAPPPPPPVVEKKPKPAGVVPDISALKVNEAIVLDKIYFIAGRHTLRDGSGATLENLYQQLKAHPGVKLSIEGHVCCLKNGIPDAMDDDTHEIALSVNRARAIYLYLVKKGIDKDRLSYKGFGASHRIVTEEFTEEDADKNRRVELRVVE